MNINYLTHAQERYRTRRIASAFRCDRRSHHYTVQTAGGSSNLQDQRVTWRRLSQRRRWRDREQNSGLLAIQFRDDWRQGKQRGVRVAG